jgi:hypothetical protein
MYSPFAQDQIRFNQEQLLRQVATAHRLSEGPQPATDASTAHPRMPRLRLALPGVLHRGSSTAPCTDR